MSSYKVVYPPSPLSPASEESPTTLRDRTAQSRQQKRLEKVLRRYVSGDVRGRSFLVSGHRGAGKTTMVLYTVQWLTAEMLNQRNRPLLVPMNGPSLLDAANVVASSADNEAQREAREREVMLGRLASALASAVVGEYVHRFRQLAGDDEDLRERVAQLEILLETAPTAAELRAFWEHFDVLDKGVLAAQAHDWQGPDEIVTLWRNLQVHQAIAGQATRTSSNQRTEASQEKTSIAYESTLDKLVSGLGAALTGGAVGGGLVLADQPVVGGIAAAVTGLLTAFTLGFSRERTVDRTQDALIEFKMDTTRTALPRLMPLLVKALRDIGLAPVFVVDELDKVKAHHRQLQTLINGLKSFVTEQSFFVFITNRDYFEFLENRSLIAAFPVEHTWFSDRLYVVYSPSELHQYLDRIISPVDESDDDTSDGRLLQNLVLLHAARSHLYSLREEIETRVDDDGVFVRDTAEDLSKRPPRHILQMQLAIESVLEDDGLDLIEEGPYFIQVLLDALYYPTEMWPSDPGEVLDVRPDVLDAYLCRRQERARGDAPPDPEKRVKPEEVSPWNGTIQRACVRLIGRLCSVAELVKNLPDRAKGLEGLFVGPLLEPAEEEGRFRWLVARDGTRHDESAEALATEAPDTLAVEVAELVEEHLQFARGGMNALANLGFLPRSPTWTEFRTAMGEGDRRVIAQFVDEVARRLPELTVALALTVALSAMSSKSPEWVLRKYSELYLEREARDGPRPDFQVLLAVLELTTDVDVRELSALWPTDPVEEGALARVGTVLEQLAGLKTASRAVRAELDDASWKSWRERLTTRESFAGPIASAPADIVDYTFGLGPTNHFRPRLAEMALWNWGSTFVMACRSGDADRRAWLGTVSLAALGFPTPVGRPAVLVILSAGNSPLARSRPCKRVGLLGLKLEQLEVALSSAGSVPPHFTHVCIEQDEVDQDAFWTVFRQVNHLLGGIDVEKAAIAATREKSEARKVKEAPVKVIQNPKDADDLVRQWLGV